MKSARLDDPADFLARTAGLLQDEARHNLIISLAWLLHDRPEVYPEFGLWVVEEEGRAAAAALITPPFNLILADAPAPALAVLADGVRRSGIPVSGVMANRPTVDRFNEIWAAAAGVVPRLRMAQGVFALEQVQDHGTALGAPRWATPADHALVVEWNMAFGAEALPGVSPDPERVERMIGYRLDPATEDAGFWLWEDGGEPVALVGYGGPMPGAIRIGPVYTPPERRRRGYGTALVAATSSWLLAHGRRRCFLYTDLANPTSNSIYRRIGYHQVAESAEYAYEPVGE